MEKIEKSRLPLQKHLRNSNLIIIMSLLSLFSCSNKKRTIVKYNSIEYKEKSKTFKVSIEEAANKAAKVFFDKNPNNAEYDFRLDLLLNDYYIFREYNSFYNLKTGNYNLSGIWVDGKNGEVLVKEKDDIIKVTLKIPFSDLTSYSGPLLKKKLK